MVIHIFCTWKKKDVTQFYSIYKSEVDYSFFKHIDSCGFKDIVKKVLYIPKNFQSIPQ